MTSAVLPVLLAVGVSACVFLGGVVVIAEVVTLTAS